MRQRICDVDGREVDCDRVSGNYKAFNKWNSIIATIVANVVVMVKDNSFGITVK